MILLINQNDAFGVAAPVGNSVKLAWDNRSSPETVGYRVHYGTKSGSYSASVDVGNVLTNSVSGLASDVTNFFAVTSYDAKMIESDYSNEISVTPGVPTVQFDTDSSGLPALTIQGTAGHTYDLEATEDFVTWTTIGTTTPNSTGAIRFVDPSATNFSKRFYRVHDR